MSGPKRGWVVDLGMLAYRPAADLQAEVLTAVADGRIPSTLLLVEHPPVLTLGASFHPENLLLPPREYAAMGIEIEKTDRGGDVTYHGPGQRVAYPIFNVAELGKDLHKWLRDLEEAVIRALAHWGLDGCRFPPRTGVWVGGQKVCAIGIKVKRWVSMHGIALNCNNDLSPFGVIVPCGIRDYGVTSLTRLVGRDVAVSEATPVLLDAFGQVFGMELVPKSREELESAIVPPAPSAP
ncbi:MAG: lipoyl(octanoyl) transferase LipB [Fimbriimonadaceae bacterium]